MSYTEQNLTVLPDASNALCGRQRAVDTWREACKNGDEETLNRLRTSRMACYIGNCSVESGLGPGDMIVAYDDAVGGDQLATSVCPLWNVYTPPPQGV